MGDSFVRMSFSLILFISLAVKNGIGSAGLGRSMRTENVMYPAKGVHVEGSYSLQTGSSGVASTLWSGYGSSLASRAQGSAAMRSSQATGLPEGGPALYAASRRFSSAMPAQASLILKPLQQTNVSAFLPGYQVASGQTVAQTSSQQLSQASLETVSQPISAQVSSVFVGQPSSVVTVQAPFQPSSQQPLLQQLTQSSGEQIGLASYETKTRHGIPLAEASNQPLAQVTVQESTGQQFVQAGSLTSYPSSPQLAVVSYQSVAQASGQQPNQAKIESSNQQLSQSSHETVAQPSSQQFVEAFYQSVNQYPAQQGYQSVGQPSGRPPVESTFTVWFKASFWFQAITDFKYWL
ncbi:hypothetical protein E1301_Tti013854 [Triplophysa tibetana]|uniref:Uncharacterized protein n=1 Tax=Triplophysa tibetana TaxID=1572043 RepID=A0A5A9P4Z5_9TELE|nr:hypothetical protein E1301_Tti013854 [Triplophysa tibetana]